MKKTIGLISVVAIVMALMIAFSGVASASWLTEYMPEKQTVNTLIGDDRTAIGDQGSGFWKSSSTSKFGSFEEMIAYSRLPVMGVKTTTSDEVGKINDPCFGGTCVFNVKGDNPPELSDEDRANMAKARKLGLSGYVSVSRNTYRWPYEGDSRLPYEERSSASGSFVFHKAMSSTSKITTP